MLSLRQFPRTTRARPTPDRDNVYEVTVVARDDAFNSGTLDVVVTVTDQNEGPEISGQQSLSFTENQATERVLATYSAKGPRRSESADDHPVVPLPAPMPATSPSTRVES